MGLGGGGGKDEHPMGSERDIVTKAWAKVLRAMAFQVWQESAYSSAWLQIRGQICDNNTFIFPLGTGSHVLK